ncbi:MAG: S8 family serine peptidase [Acidimicrobiia bacterium]
MRSRALVVGIGLAMIVTACQPGTDQSTTTEPDGLEVNVDPDWECYYLDGVIAIQAAPGEVDAMELAAAALLVEFDETAAPTNAGVIFNADDDPPEDIEGISANIDGVLGLVSTTLDPLRAAIYLGDQDPSIVASPIHAVGLAGHWTFKPGTDPEVMEGELPAVDDGYGPYVAVIDSGFVPGGPSWAGGRNVFYDPFDEDPDPGLASHGTFITGLIRQLSPDNRVSIARAPFVSKGRFIPRAEDPLQVSLSSELHVFQALERLIMRHAESQDVEALNMSLGTYTCDPNEDALLVTLVAALERWDTEIGGQSFAAGGNEDYPAPFWPGALDTVRAVGAANQSGLGQQVVWVSNDEELAPPRYWIDDVAPGSNLVGLATPGPNTEGVVVAWSGSSFASAVAAALYARGDTPVRDYGIDWWPDASVDYDAVSGLSYTKDPATSGVKTVP